MSVRLAAWVCYAVAGIWGVAAAMLVVNWIGEVFRDWKWWFAGEKIHDTYGLVVVTALRIMQVAVALFVSLLGLVLGLAVVLIGLSAAFVGHRLRRGRRWARVVVLVLAALMVVGIGSRIRVHGWVDDNGAWPIAAIPVPVLTVALLYTRSARHWFASAPSQA